MLKYPCFERKYNMDKDLEIKLYEKLGVKFFKKIIMLIYKVIIKTICLLKKSQEKDDVIKYQTNYSIGAINSVDDLKRFKKNLYFNSSIHIIALIPCITVLFIATSIFTTINAIICTIINIYCIILQRYNYIRLDNTISKATTLENKQKSTLQESIIEEKLTKDISISILEKSKEEKQISFEEFLNVASVKELKDFQTYLLNAKKNITEDQTTNYYPSAYYSFGQKQVLALSLKKTKPKH